MKRIKAQFTELRVIKLNFLYSWIMFQLDFAKNYMCQESSRVIQSAHWLKNMVTIHPIVIHYMISDKPGIYHKSFIYLSPVDRHNGTMVFALLKLFDKRDLLPFLKSVYGEHYMLNFVHYITE